MCRIQGYRLHVFGVLAIHLALATLLSAQEGPRVKFSGKDRPVEEVLKSVCQPLGLSASVAPDAAGVKISETLDNVDAKWALTYLLEKNHLVTVPDVEAALAGDKKLWVYAGAPTGKLEVRLVFLSNIEGIEAFLSASAARFRTIRECNYSVDRERSAVVLEGTKEAVDQVEKLLLQFQASEGGGTVPFGDPIVVERIPLRYARVGKHTRRILGRDVVVDGIEKTLEAMLETPILRLGTAEAPAAGEAAPGTLAPGALVQQTPAGPQTVTEKSKSIFVDERTNSVIVVDTRRMVERVRKIVDSLDQPVPQVEISVVVAQVNRTYGWALGTRIGGVSINPNERKDSGVYGSAAGQPLGYLSSTTTQTGGAGEVATNTTQGTSSTYQRVAQPPDPSNLLLNAAATSFFGAPTNFGGLGFAWDDISSSTRLDLELTAMEQKQLAKRLSNPRVVTLDHQEALFQAGELTKIRIEGGGLSTGSLQEVNSGIILRVIPHVTVEPSTGEAWVKLEVYAEVSEPTNADPDLFRVGTTSCGTVLIVRDGQPAIMSGLQKSLMGDRREQIPILGSIPLLGALFGRSTEENDADEVTFFIIPKVIGMPGVVAGRAFHQNDPRRESEDRADMDNALRDHPTVDEKHDLLKGSSSTREPEPTPPPAEGGPEAPKPPSPAVSEPPAAAAEPRTPVRAAEAAPAPVDAAPPPAGATARIHGLIDRGESGIFATACACPSGETSDPAVRHYAAGQTIQVRTVEYRIEEITDGGVRLAHNRSRLLVPLADRK